MTTPDDARFERLARAFCTALESGEGDGRHLFGWLVDLLAAATRLSDSIGTDEDHGDPPHLDSDCKLVEDHLRQWLPASSYWVVEDPLPGPEFEIPGKDDLGLAGLDDDVLDIYRDLRRGLHLADRGSLAEAVWEWRWGFQNHWGRHATSALVPLHKVLLA